jgi:hypothetical protein
VAQLTQRTQREPAATDHTPKAPSALQTEQIAALLQTLTELADRLGDPRTPP